MSRLPAKPRIKPHVAIVPVARENVLIRGPGVFVRLSGEGVLVLDAMLPFLDGRHDVAAIARASNQTEADVVDVLEFLQADRVLEDGDERESLGLSDAWAQRLAPQLNYFSDFTATVASTQNRLSKARVLVLGLGHVGAAAAEALAAAGVGTIGLADSGALAPADRTLAAYAHAPDGAARSEALAAALGDGRSPSKVRAVALPSPDMRRLFTDDLRTLFADWDHVLVAADEPITTLFLRANEAALARGVRWTCAFLDNHQAFVGPAVLPGQSACWRCYDLRVKGAHPNMDRLLVYEASREAAPRAARATLPTFGPIAGAFAAQSVIVQESGISTSPLVNRVVKLDLSEFRAEPHRVLRMPRCPDCAKGDIPDVDKYDLAPVRLG